LGSKQDDPKAAPSEPPLRLRGKMLQLLRSEEALLTAGDDPGDDPVGSRWPKTNLLGGLEPLINYGLW